MIQLLEESDLAWVATMIDVVERHTNSPWRVALDELDDLQRAAQPTTARRFAAVVGALQRLTGGRLRNARAARRARGLVLGHPALVHEEREARIEHAALMLGTTPHMVELMLWSDLPRGRPIQLEAGRPSEYEVAAFANLALLQRAVRRAQAVVLTVGDGDRGDSGVATRDHDEDDPALIVRAAMQRGLLVSGVRASRLDPPRIEIAGPLSLCHGTSVYGRALADLMPLLAELRSWSMEIQVELPLASYSTHVASPVLLPSPPARLVATPAPITRIVRGLAKLAPRLRVHPLPPAIAAGTSMLWPDLEVIDGARRVYVELVGFWTREYVETRLAAYRALGFEVLLCVDGSRAAGDSNMLPPEVLVFTKLVPLEELHARLRPS